MLFLLGEKYFQAKWQSQDSVTTPHSLLPSLLGNTYLKVEVDMYEWSFPCLVSSLKVLANRNQKLYLKLNLLYLFSPYLIK